MWSLITSVLLRWAALKALLRALASLGWLLPLGWLLKAVGVPALILLAVLAIPLFLVLAVIGLPIVLVLVVGGILLMLTMWMLSLGVFVLKLAIPALLIYWLLRWFFRDSSAHTRPDSGP
jgi:hypothetical protein